jgi:ribonuclease J
MSETKSGSSTGTGPRLRRRRKNGSAGNNSHSNVCNSVGAAKNDSGDRANNSGVGKTNSNRGGVSNKNSNRGAKSGGGAARSGKKPSAPLKIIPLGGLDGIGKNMTAFEHAGDLILVDAGLMFPDDDHPGVDLILPDYTYVLENADRLRGIIITHGHEDHTGALPYLLKDLSRQVPIFGSKLTLGLIAGKFEEHRIKNVQFREVAGGNTVRLGGFICDFFSVNHSIPAALGLFIQSDAGRVLHTGDFKLDQTPIDGVQTDYAAITRFANIGVDLMMSDSTNAANANFTRSEAEVGRALRTIMAGASKRVIVASFASHIHRIQQVCDAAVACKRKVAVTGRSMITNTQIARDLGYLEINDSNIIDAYAARDIPADRVVILCTGSQGEPLSALARMANGEHRTVVIEQGDTVIISATPVPGNEKAVTRVINALAKAGADIYDKQRALVHVSGHAGAEELKLMLNLARPRHFMPVHGEALHLRAHAELARSVGLRPINIHTIDNGDVLLLKDGRIEKGEPVESGIIYVDGLSVGDISNVVLKDRQTLASDGIVTVVCMLRRRDYRAAGTSEVIMRGVSGGDDPELIADAVKAVDKTVANSAHEHRSNPNRLKRALRESLSALLWERVRRRPMIIPIIMEV